MTAPVAKTCIQCGEQFVKNPSMARKQYELQRFCSKPCAGAHRSAQRPSCGVEGCDRLHKVHGLCELHFWRSTHAGTLADPVPTPAHDRFWRQVSVGQPDECWEWQGRRNNHGYGQFHVSNTPLVRMYSHRYAYKIATGLDVQGWVIRHHCDNPPCVNPSHLIHGTQADNIADAVKRGRLKAPPVARPRKAEVSS